MHRTLIVARMKPDAERAVAEVFARSDETELPHLIGVRSRTLFRFHDLYMHLVEGDRPVGPAIDGVREAALFRQISEELSHYIDAYDPASWRSPADARATEFYRWDDRSS